MLIILSVLLTMSAAAQPKKFTVVKQNPITTVKDQHRSGTCWAYATLGFFESEIQRKTGRTYDLCEMFVVNKDYRKSIRIRIKADASVVEIDKRLQSKPLQEEYRLPGGDILLFRL